MQFVLERGKKETHPVQTGVLYFLEHEGYFVVGFAFTIRSVFRMYFAQKDILTCKESRVKKGLFIQVLSVMQEKNEEREMERGRVERGDAEKREERRLVGKSGEREGGWKGKSGERRGFWAGRERGDWWRRVPSGMQGNSEEREMEKGRVERGDAGKRVGAEEWRTRGRMEGEEWREGGFWEGVKRGDWRGRAENGREDGRGRVGGGFWEGRERVDLCGRLETGVQGKSEERKMEKGRVKIGRWKREE